MPGAEVGRHHVALIRVKFKHQSIPLFCRYFGDYDFPETALGKMGPRGAATAQFLDFWFSAEGGSGFLPEADQGVECYILKPEH